MTRRKLKILEFQNMKTEFLKNSHEERHVFISSLVKTSHKKLKTPKMTRRKLKTSELQNTKTKNL